MKDLSEISNYVLSSLYDITKDILNDFRAFGRELTRWCMTGHKVAKQEISTNDETQEIHLNAAALPLVLALTQDPFNHYKIQPLEGQKGLFLVCVGGPKQGNAFHLGQGPRQEDKLDVPDSKESKQMLRS